MAKLSKFAKVNDAITINRYDNGWMVEIGGMDSNDDWKNGKILCNTEEELLALVKEYNSIDVNN